MAQPSPCDCDHPERSAGWHQIWCSSRGARGRAWARAAEAQWKRTGQPFEPAPKVRVSIKDVVVKCSTCKLDFHCPAELVNEKPDEFLTQLSRAHRACLNHLSLEAFARRWLIPQREEIGE